MIGNEEIAAVIGPKKAEAVNQTQQLLSQRLAQYGIVVKQFTINELRAPPAVIEAINQKNVMQQQALTAQNELQKNRSRRRVTRSRPRVRRRRSLASRKRRRRRTS